PKARPSSWASSCLLPRNAPTATKITRRPKPSTHRRATITTSLTSSLRTSPTTFIKWLKSSASTNATERQTAHAPEAHLVPPDPPHPQRQNAPGAVPDPCSQRRAHDSPGRHADHLQQGWLVQDDRWPLPKGHARGHPGGA